MRWPWKTREDPVIKLLDAILAEMKETRDEHSKILDKLNAMAEGVGRT